jgi:hypothetical protein
MPPRGQRSGGSSLFFLNQDTMAKQLKRWTLADIFARCVVCPDKHCWLWQGSAKDNGYGRIRHLGRWTTPHRLALMLAFGWYEERPELEAAHGACHNRLCCNPVHMNWKTAKGNAEDRTRDGTATIGERNGATKLAAAQVLAIRTEYVKGSKEYGGAALARKYGVSEALISLIARRIHRTFI